VTISLNISKLLKNFVTVELLISLKIKKTALKFNKENSWNQWNFQNVKAVFRWT